MSIWNILQIIYILLVIVIIFESNRKVQRITSQELKSKIENKEEFVFHGNNVKSLFIFSFIMYFMSLLFTGLFGESLNQPPVVTLFVVLTYILVLPIFLFLTRKMRITHEYIELKSLFGTTTINFRDIQEMEFIKVDRFEPYSNYKRLNYSSLSGLHKAKLTLPEHDRKDIDIEGFRLKCDQKKRECIKTILEQYYTINKV